MSSAYFRFSRPSVSETKGWSDKRGLLLGCKSSVLVELVGQAIEVGPHGSILSRVHNLPNCCQF